MESDIFGFGRKIRPEDESTQDEKDNKPLHQFDVEQMMEILHRYSIGGWHPSAKFMNEIQWGFDYGAVKLEVDPGMRFLIKRLARDLEGQPRWITTKLYQLNRRGYGGYEESVAAEVFDNVQEQASGQIPGPVNDYQEIDRLVHYVAVKMRNVAERKFIYEGIKKVAPDDYQIVFNVGGQGVEARDHKRVEENITEVSYDRSKGTIRITNYNVSSKVGGPHSWTIQPSDMELYFFPSQSRDEIAEAVATRFRYY